MKQTVIAINENALKNALKVLRKYEIEFRILGYPDGKVEVTESYPSKINIHANMSRFAKQLGYKGTVQAIADLGRMKFKEKFNKEFTNA